MLRIAIRLEHRERVWQEDGLARHRRRLERGGQVKELAQSESEHAVGVDAESRRGEDERATNCLGVHNGLKGKSGE